MLDSRKLTLILASVGYRCTLVKLMLSRLVDFVKTGTCQTLAVSIEGKFGVGKTTFAIFSGLAIIGAAAAKLFERYAFPPLDESTLKREELLKLKSLCEAARALYEGDYDAVYKYVRSLVAFGPFELVQKIATIVDSNDFAPFLIVDDAGIFFSRTGWLVYSRAWREAVGYLVSTLDLMRTFTSAFLMTTPSRKHVLTRLAELMNMRVTLRKLSRPQKLALDSVVLVTDRGARYATKTTTIIAGKVAEAYMPINKEPEPVFIVGRKIIDRVMQDVNEVRKQWIKYIMEKVSQLLEAAEEEAMLQEGALLSQIFAETEEEEKKNRKRRGHREKKYGEEVNEKETGIETGNESETGTEAEDDNYEEE